MAAALGRRWVDARLTATGRWHTLRHNYQAGGYLMTTLQWSPRPARRV